MAGGVNKPTLFPAILGEIIPTNVQNEAGKPECKNEPPGELFARIKVLVPNAKSSPGGSFLHSDPSTLHSPRIPGGVHTLAC